MALDLRELEQFLTLAAMKLTGSSNAGIKAELYDVLKEFFGDSGAWREDIQFQATAGSDTYNLTPLEDGQIIRLIGVWDDKGIPVPAFMPDFATLKLIHAPDSTPTTKWMARTVKNVTLPITSENVPVAPAWTLKVYSVHILDGLLGKMKMTKNSSYSDDSGSVYHLKRFRTAIQLAKSAVERDNGVGNQAWAFPRFARGSQRGGVSTAWPTRVF